MRLRPLILVLFLYCSAGWAPAQTLADSLGKSAGLSPDLAFPAEIKELSMFSPLGMAIYKPEGAGPFPAMVIVHSCGGLRPEIREWTKAVLSQGYVALVLDSNGPRGLKVNCYPPTKVTVARGIKDAFQALAHLKHFPQVDSSRVGLIGFSWGAMVGVMASSHDVAEALSQGNRFSAAVSLYPMCNFPGTAKFPTPYEYLRPDVDRPLLVLMGDQDTETPASECLPRIEALKQKSAPVESHLYSGATHCWDCASINGQVKTDFQGISVAYRYSPEVTEDSKRRAFEFLARNLEPR